MIDEPKGCLSEIGKPFEIDPRFTMLLAENERLREALRNLCPHPSERCDVTAMPDFYKQWLLSLNEDQAQEFLAYLTEPHTYVNACRHLEQRFPDVWEWLEDPIPF